MACARPGCRKNERATVFRLNKASGGLGCKRCRPALGQSLPNRQELGVRYVLEGSVQRDQNHVRVNAQLIDGETGALSRICGGMGRD